MLDFFYGFGLLVALSNFAILSSSKTIYNLVEWLVKFKKVTGKNPTEVDFRNVGDRELIFIWSNIVVITVIWMIFGLLTSDWMIFILIFIVNILFNFLKKKLDSFDKIKYLLSWLKTLIGTCTISFLVINHFHLHINLTKYLLSLI